MKNSLGDLNNHLFEALERLNDDELDEEQLEKEMKRAKAVKEIGSTIIDTARLQLDVLKHKAEYYSMYSGNDRERMPDLLESKG